MDREAKLKGLRVPSRKAVSNAWGVAVQNGEPVKKVLRYRNSLMIRKPTRKRGYTLLIPQDLQLLATKKVGANGE